MSATQTSTNGNGTANTSGGRIERRSFSKIGEVVPMPSLLEVQIESYRSFLQLDTAPQCRVRRGLHLVFESIFPISDTHGIYSLEYVDYSIGNPRYGVEECRERGMTFAAPLRATLRLVTRDKESPDKPVKDVVEQSVFLGELPIMTEEGTFVINGAERVVVSQLHRSPGVFFDETIHPNGKRLFSARILPTKGPWLEFSLDINDILYVHIDRRRKMPATVLLRALGYTVQTPDTNMVYLSINDAPSAVERLAEGGVLCCALGPTDIRLVTHLDVTDEGVAEAVRAFKALARAA